MYLELNYPEINTQLNLSVSREDIEEFLWEQKIGRKYSFSALLVEPDGIKTYREIALRWLHNEIDENKLLYDSSFYDFCKEKYESVAYSKYEAEEEQ